MACLNFITDEFFIKKLLGLLLLLVTALLSGCGAVIVAGVGAGAFSYYSGNLVRIYEADYNQAVRVSSKVMKQLEFSLTSRASDGLKTVLVAERADKTPITIIVEEVEDNTLKIGVRNGLIGVSNLKASEQVHDHIAQQLAEQQIEKNTLNQKQIKVISATHPKIKLYNDTIHTTTIENSVKSGPITPTVVKSTPLEPPFMKSPADKGSEAVDADTAVPVSVDVNELVESIQEEPPVPDENDPTDSVPSIFNATANDELKEEVSRSSPFYRSTHYIFYKKQEQTIPVTAYEVLDTVADSMKENPDALLEIRAYTDSTGDPVESLKISRYRAHSIRDYLIEKGIDPAKMKAEGYGASNFLESNRTESLRAINRRVELRII